MNAVLVRRLATGDEHEVVRFEAAFDYSVDLDMTRTFLADPRHHLFVAYVDDEPAGFVSAAQVFHPDKQPELFLNEISVIEPFRRRGVASQLILALRKLATELGCASMWVLTDEGNPSAMGLYSKTGGRWNGERHVMFEYDLAT